MAKKNDIVLPKYLTLAKGAMWFDVEGPESSGVRLIKGSYTLVSRSTPSNSDDVSDVPIDLNENKNNQQGGYGFIKNTENTHYFETSTIPNEKSRNILNAYNEGILVSFDPEVNDPSAPLVKNHFEYNKDGDLVFIGKNKDVYKKLNTYTFIALKDYIGMCGTESRNNLIDMYHYESNGYNPKSRPRFEVLELLRAKLNTLGSGISAISVNEDE